MTSVVRECLTVLGIHCLESGGDSFMELDIYTLSKAGLSEKQIEEIAGCGDKEMQIRMLRKCRYQLLDEIHGKQQSLDEIDYMISRIKELT